MTISPYSDHHHPSSSPTTTTTNSTISLALKAVALFVVVAGLQFVLAGKEKKDDNNKPSRLSRAAQRRIQHTVTGLAIVQVSYAIPHWNVCVGLLLVATIGLYILHRYYFDVFRQAFGAILRPAEVQRQRLPGALYFVLGTLVTMILLQLSSTNEDENWMILRYAIECLSLADPMASWVGSSVQSPRLSKGSSLAGCLACFGTALAIGYLRLIRATNDGSTGTIPVIVGAIGCTLAEAIPFADDNLTIPVSISMVVRFCYWFSKD